MRWPHAPAFGPPSNARLRRALAYLLNERFLSPCGIRSMSKYYKDHPYSFRCEGQTRTRTLFAGRFRNRHVRRQLELEGTVCFR